MTSSNAVTRALELIQSHWDHYVLNSQAPICRWVVKQNALSLVETFFHLCAEGENDNDDVFFRFESPFTDYCTYGKTLSNELASQVAAEKENIEVNGNIINWISDHREDNNNAGVGYLRNLFHFVISLGLKESEKFIAYLSPITMDNKKAWKRWWADVLSLHLPPQLRLMVCDIREQNNLGVLANKFPDKIISLELDLDGSAIMRQLMNEYGDQDDDCTHFRKAYYDLTLQISKRDLQGIVEATLKALPLARQIGFPHLEITVLCTAGNGFSGVGNLAKAEEAFDQARQIAKESAHLPLIKERPDLKADLPGGNIFDQLSVQSLFHKSAALITYDLFDRALESYREAVKELNIMLAKTGLPKQVDWTNGGITVFYLVEALRMCGYCLERLNQRDEALPFYLETIDICQKLDLVTRNSTSAAYAGRALLKIYYDQNKKKNYLQTEKKMNSLLGESWEEELPKRAN